jgi:hypothetical protein
MEHTQAAVGILPDEMLASILCRQHLKLAEIASARLVCRWWGAVGRDTLCRERRLMADAARTQGGCCANQWYAVEALTQALIDDSIPALLRVLDTDTIGPNDPVTTGALALFRVDMASRDIGSTRQFTGDTYVKDRMFSADGGFGLGIPPLIATPLVMAVGYGALECVRALIDLGAYPMPHLDALITFVIECCVWSTAVIATTETNSSRVATTRPPRPPDIPKTLGLLLGAFHKRSQRVPSGITPPLHALVYILAYKTAGVEDQAVLDKRTRDAVCIARILMDAGYDPRASWQCRGPRILTDVRMNHSGRSLTTLPSERLVLLNALAAETAIDAVEHDARCARSEVGQSAAPFEALAAFYRDYSPTSATAAVVLP